MYFFGSATNFLTAKAVPIGKLILSLTTLIVLGFVFFIAEHGRHKNFFYLTVKLGL